MSTMLQRILQGVGIGAASFGLAACSAVGPAYHPPRLPAGLDAGQSAPFESMSAAAAVLTPLPAHWWKLYDNAVLDGLVTQAFKANTDLRVATANVERAMAVLHETHAATGVQTDVEGGISTGQISSLGIAPAGGTHGPDHGGPGGVLRG